MTTFVPLKSSSHPHARWSSARSRSAALALLAAAFVGLSAPAHAFNPDTVAPSSISLQGISYYSAPVFADAIKMAREWQTNIGGVDTLLKPDSGKLNSVGLPTASSSTEVFTSWFESNAIEKDLVLGRYVVSWTGTGDVTLTGGGVSLISSSVNSSGGRRVYSCTTSRPTISLTGLNSSGLSSLNVWLPHPDDRANTSLEPAERTAYNTAHGITESSEAFYFSPVLIRVLKERPWSAIRFMDWTATNNQPASSWSDRRPPSYAEQTGSWLSRDAVTGVSPEYDKDGKKVWHGGGVAWEYAVALCNATGRNLWINVPHRAVLSIGGSSDYVANLAKTIAYGSDATGTPYSSSYTGSKVWKPLASNLEVFVEYSNEVWNSKFDQRAFTENQRTDTNVPQQVAINALQVWTAFENAAPALKSGTVDRVVRLLGCQQVTSSNLKSSLDELYTAGKDGATGYADAVTTASYFGNAIELYVRDAILEGTPNPQGGDEIYPGQKNSPVYPAYDYTDAAKQRNTDVYVNKAFDEWTRRILYGDSNSGNAFDTTGKLGGIEAGIYTEAVARGLRVIATEGGASIYTDKYDNASPDDDLLTNFVAKFSSHPRMAELQKIHLEFGRMRGLRSYNMFTLTGDPEKWGQWGVLKLDGTQDTAPEAVKYRTVRSWFDEFSTIRPAGAGSTPIGTAPSFTTAEDLGEFRVNTALSLPIATGNATSLTVVGKIFVPGSPALAVTVSGTSATITGTPTKPGLNYVLLRAMDNDKDPAWRVFKFNVKNWSKNLYFNDLATTTTPFASTSYTNFLVSTNDGSASLKVDPLTTGSTNKVLRVTAAVPVNFEWDTGTTDPLGNLPFNFDTVKLGRGNTAIIGARIDGLSEAGNVIVSEDVTLSGAVNTVAEFVRDANWKNLFSVKITFYSAKDSAGVITPAAGGVVEEFKANL